MKELIAKLNELIEIAERKIKDAADSVNLSHNIINEYNKNKELLDERATNISLRESQADAIDNVKEAQREANALKDQHEQELKRVYAKHDQLNKEHEDKVKKLSDNRAQLEKEKRDLSEAQLQLDKDKKNYRQEVINAVHKDSQRLK